MKRFDWEDFFAQHRIFSSLDKREITLLLRQDVSTERACHQGEVILQEGGPGDTIFLIGAGSVQVVLPRDGGREIPISTLRQGEYFGEMAVLEHKERAATVRAKEDCILLEIKGKAFTDVLQDHADIELKILAMQSERIRVLNHSLLLKVQSVDEKIDIFNTTLNAELKSVEATLKATQAIFDQTKIRTDEVITSTERHWTRMTKIGSAVGGVITMLIALLGWMGVAKFQDFKQQINAAQQEVKQQVADAHKVIEERLQSTQANTELIKQYAEHVGEIKRQQDANTGKLQKFSKVMTPFIDPLYPQIKEEIKNKNPSRANDLYDDIHTIKKSL